jgi:hypothetical protein
MNTSQYSFNVTQAVPADLREGIKDLAEGTDVLTFTDAMRQSVSIFMECISKDIARRAKEAPGDEDLLRDAKMFMNFFVKFERINLATMRLAIDISKAKLPPKGETPAENRKATVAPAAVRNAAVPAAATCNTAVPASSDAGLTPAIRIAPSATPSRVADSGKTPQLRAGKTPAPQPAPQLRAKPESGPTQHSKIEPAQRCEDRRSSSSLQSIIESSRSKRPTPAGLKALDELGNDSGNRAYPWDLTSGNAMPPAWVAEMCAKTDKRQNGTTQA